MIRALVLLITFCVCGTAWAQSASNDPILRTSLDQDTAIPGQPLIYRVTMLVPTWMPSAPVFPSFEVPNVIVRLPSGASRPVSERIGGETWSGVSRSYRFYPMVPGTIQIPAGSVQLTYADPQTREPVDTELQTEAFDIHGVLPPGGEGINPFLAARALKLERTIGGDPASLSAGDALTLTITATVSGVSPMFVPPLSPSRPIDGLAVYAKAPLVEEKEDRGLLSGKRIEEATVIGENAGAYQIPEVSLSWYDLQNETIETAVLPAIDITVVGVPLETHTPSPGLDWRTIAVWLIAVLLIFCFLAWVVRRYGGVLARQRKVLRQQVRSSEWYAFRQLQTAFKAKDYNATLRAYRVWRGRIADHDDGKDWQRFQSALANLGEVIFDTSSASCTSQLTSRWNALTHEATHTRRVLRAKSHRQRRSSLSRLNPV